MSLPQEFETQPDPQPDTGEGTPHSDQADSPPVEIYENPVMEAAVPADESFEDAASPEVEEPAGDAVIPAEASRSFEELTLAEAAAQFFRAPQATIQAIRQVSQQPSPRFQMMGSAAAPPIRLPSLQMSAAAPIVSGARPAARISFDEREAIKLGLRLMAFVAALWGNSILATAPLRTESLALNVGAPFMLLGFFLWIAAEVYGDWPAIRARWAPRDQNELSEEVVAKPKRAAEGWAGFHPARVFLAFGGLFTSFLAFRFTADNLFTLVGFWSWILSVVLWVSALAPAGWGILPTIRWVGDQVRGFHWRRNWTLWVLILILLLGAVFRLSNLSDAPPEMTSDHVEKILDSQRTLNGETQVFFPNNGGREPFQMYAIAMLSQIPGLGMNFTTLKLLSIIEGLVAVVAMYWMGREVVGIEDRKLGNLVGLMLAALVAASYWHTALSRLGLRIVLTTIVTPLLLIFLARALRSNRRGDFIKAGVVLGFGLYTYQAVRMLPVVIVVGVVMAFLFNGRRGRGNYIVNFAVLVLVSFIVFVPLFGFALQYPEDFLRRTSGRLLGDDIIQTTNEKGEIVQRNATLQERLAAFNTNLSTLADNYRNALLMFNWKGDVAWINAAPNRPAMDIFTATLFTLGLAAWLARMVKRRDVFDWLVPLALLIMLLPSALSIAYPVENPSHTRTSGALPEAYLIAALPLALILMSIMRLAKARTGLVVNGAIVLVIVLGAYSANSSLYFGEYRTSYLDSSLPYSEAGRILRGFAESDGSFGNAFMIGYPFWWDHRAVGIEAGRTDWPNGIVSSSDIPGFLFLASQKTDRYRFDPALDILFFYAAEDDETQMRLEGFFPQGQWQLRQSYQLDDTYKIFRVPAMGSGFFGEWVARNTNG